ncbi:hypothetical protein [Nocardia sp. NRRL S-836]|uniref:hypothetical protein n=1 Tax=Nocardia sp. NRRL S-836 TaxID=1519492 RepID=UPI0012F716A8|nr:hypothetical protein [Nocardia sp. NRRL S-836]
MLVVQPGHARHGTSHRSAGVELPQCGKHLELTAFSLEPLEPTPSLRSYEGMGDGQARYGRVRVLNAHRHLRRYPRYVEEHHAREQELAQLADQPAPHPTRRQQHQVKAFLDGLRDLTPRW